MRKLNRSMTMNEYEFTLKFRLPNAGAAPESFVDALAEAGCDDALVGVGQPERIALDFNREARSAVEAITSAIQDVKQAIPGVELVEASPDFVSATDVAELAGCSRQNVRKWIVGHAATFPLAVHEGSPSVWHLANVLAWLSEQQKRPVDAMLLEIADTNMKVNIAREAHRLPGARLPKEFAPLFA
jgi:hypothetical protein